MITKTAQGKYQVRSENGHQMLGEYNTRAEAMQRIAEVERYKKIGAPRVIKGKR